MFPESFNFKIYRNYKDLNHFNDNDLNSHYTNHGIKEGRTCSLGQSRDFLKNVPTIFKKCLEIGPFDVPVLKGVNVKYFDVLNSEDLKKRAIEINRINNINNIPFIDYVEPNGNIEIINEKFDVVLTCHSIEHSPDLILHLKNISNLLNDNGYYIAIIPDKRYCFDHFIPESSIADILDSYFNKQKFHKIKSVIEHRTLTCHNNSIQHWNGEHGSQSIGNVKNAIDEYLNNKDSYIDVHAWQFTPDSFKNIIENLYNLNYIDFKIKNIYNTIYGSCEFLVILEK